jgi:multicomponent Na+:H+ antiporter subunit C
MGAHVLGYLNYWLAALLLLIGLYGMLAQRNLVKKLMAMNILQVAVILFFIALADKSGATAPIEMPGVYSVAAYINPLPHALMLTAIVVGVSTTGVALALLIRIHRRYGTLEEPEVLAQLAAPLPPPSSSAFG